MKDRVLGGERDLVGVLLFGTKETKVPHGQQGGFSHMYELQSLEEPSAGSMRNVSLLLRDAPTPADEAANAGPFGHLDDGAALDLSEVLWLTSMLFNNSAAKNTRRRVYLLSNDDNPCAANTSARTRALTRSKDLMDANIWLEPFFFSPPPPRTFDLSEGSFWRELIGPIRERYTPPRRQAGDASAAPIAGDANDQSGPSTEGGLGATAGGEVIGGHLPEDTSNQWLSSCVMSQGEGLIERVRRSAHRKRILWSSDLCIREGYALSFVMVGLVKLASKPTAKKLDARTNEEISTQSHTTCAEHGTILQKEDLFKGYDYGGHWVYFDPSEVAKFGTEGLDDLHGASGSLVLLGFKDREALKVHHNLGANKFIQPTERVAGSGAAMAALVHSMHAKQKMAIARMRKGKQGQPRLVALLPQLPEASSATAPMGLPCGLHVIPLPFAEDIRSITKPPALPEHDFSPSQLDAARELVRALQLPPGTSPLGTIRNPATYTHFTYLQTLALNVPGAVIEPTVDGTLPDAAWLAESQPQLQAFQEAFSLPGVDEFAASEGGGAKRQRTATGGSGCAKPVIPTTLAEWISAHLKDQVRTLTMPTLKEFCKANALPVGGKKDDLVARVGDLLELEMARDATLRELKEGGAAAPPACD